ncbi:MAG: hypothetical protein ACRDHY_07885, partial [Anaerolineales bacterium]
IDLAMRVSHFGRYWYGDESFASFNGPRALPGLLCVRLGLVLPLGGFTEEMHSCSANSGHDPCGCQYEGIYEDADCCAYASNGGEYR